ncbi:GNAT family N-acetyltransferase [Pseudomonas sp.]|uniref:GNAT family N-acetyltransferase n=1 Tax=Pseudomonas sp. TaxID=306 RepID=UPI0028AF9CF0|nr:GNAT family N-acetyltransferase [Pseudomonas sp.]
MLIKRLPPDYASAYRALMLEAYDAHPEAFTSSMNERVALPLSWWESRLIKDAVFGAFENFSLIGAIGMALNTQEKVRHVAKLFGMYVQPHHRSKGAGFELIQTALNHAKGNEGIQAVQLTVSEGNDTAQALYERCGFRVFGIEPMAIAVNGRFISKIHMWQAFEADL